MARVDVQLPSLITSVHDGPLRFALEAGSVAEAFETLRSEHPRLALHLFDEHGALRIHVLCFHNDRNTRWLDDPVNTPLADGDELLFMQAVTGG